ncbi:MAG: tetratricopeptide repeat protein [Bacteroidetes bacterium]|nr:tetratricopeptide repeat protein [Bacteroidota bacterium]
MKKYFIITGITFAFLILYLNLNAQQTVYNDPINVTYREALRLYNQQNYGSALSVFDKYMIEETDKKSTFFENAAYYSTVCAVELGTKDAANRVQMFASDYPASAWIPAVNLELGNIYYKDNKYSSALEVYNKINSAKLNATQRSEYYYKKGYCQMKQSQFDQALASYRKVIGTKSNYSEPANYYFAHIQYQKGNYEDALKAFKAIENDRKFKKYVPLYLVKIYYQQSDYQSVIDEGKQYLTSATSQEKGDIAGLIANSYYNLNNFDLAHEYYTIYESNGKQNDDPDEQYRIGYSKFVSGKYKDAINNFQSATKAGGLVEQTSWYYLGYCYLNSDQPKFAQGAFLKAYKINTNEDIAADALFSYVKVTIEIGPDSYNDPVTIIEDFIKTNPGSQNKANAYDLLSQLYLTSNNYPGALASIEKVENPNSRLKSVYQQLAYAQGVAYFNRNAFTDAIIYFKKSLVYPVDKKLQSEALFWQGDALYQEKKYNDAANIFNQFFSSSGARQTGLYAVAFYNAAYCAFNLEQYSNTVNLFQKFLKEENNKSNLIADTYLRLADSYLITKDYNNAIHWYNKVISSNSADADYALFQKAICYGSQGDFTNKLNTLNKLITNFKKSQYYDDALYDIASTNLILNDQRHAIVYFDKLVKEKPKSSYAKKALVKMGFVYYSNNQYDQAVAALRKVIDNYPASLEAKEALVTLQNVYMDMGQVDKYIAYANSLDFVQVSTSEEDSLKFTTGENYYLNNDCNNAITALSKYVDQFPTGGFILTAYHYLSQCMEKQGNNDLAIMYYEKIIEYPENQYTVKALLKVARVMYSKEKFEKALNYYERLLQVAENKMMLLEATDGVMKSAWKTGSIPKVKEAAKKLLMTEKVSEGQIIYAHYLLGMIAMENKQYAEAEREFSITTSLSSGEMGAEALYNKILIFYRQNRLEEAENMVYELPEKYPTFDYWIAKGFILLADIYVGRDNLFQAEQTLVSVIENYKGDDLRKTAEGKLERLKASQVETPEDQENDNQ